MDSMELPPGLDVTPDDAEYEQVVNMWKAVSRNNTMDEVRARCTFRRLPSFDVAVVILGPSWSCLWEVPYKEVRRTPMCCARLC